MIDIDRRYKFSEQIDQNTAGVARNKSEIMQTKSTAARNSSDLSAIRRERVAQQSAMLATGEDELELAQDGVADEESLLSSTSI